MSGAHGYRADVDGLRAVAIIPVLLFHVGLSSFSGGYVGVDVFFVISGYLITGIIVREIDRQSFSILDFYERRARRILPALIPVIAVTLALAAWLYLPGDFESVPRSALASLLFLSNVSFFAETGYFQGGAETKPLLHTWSLAIEEQFYIGFPVFLILVARWMPHWRISAVAGAGLVSFAWAVATQHDGTGFAFYLLPPRAWELLVGALLALGAVPAVRSRALREAASIAGLAAIAWAVFIFDSRTVFPGVNALFPVLGAATLIHCAPGTAIGRLLSIGLMRAIGLISYSLYLWHWPLIVFTEYAIDAPLSGWRTLAVIAASVGLATLSWRYIEAPFRQKARFDRGAIFKHAAVATSLLCAVSGAMVAAGGWQSRFAPDVARMAAGREDYSPARDRCHDSDAARGRPACVLGANAVPTALLWGDSHGVELAFALSELEQRHDRAVIQRTQSSCPPVLGYDPPEDPRCARVNRDVFAAIRASPEIGTVYLAAFWASDRYDGPAFTAKLEHTIGALLAERRRVVLIGAVPPNPFDVPRRLARLARDGALDAAGGVSRTDIASADVRLRAIAARWQGRGLSYVEPSAILCGAGRCEIVHDGSPLYFDAHHLTVAGARRVIQPLDAG
jgi:peptidoglycan/LPS O-acetylase OafA/YrhL